MNEREGENYQSFRKSRDNELLFLSRAQITFGRDNRQIAQRKYFSDSIEAQIPENNPGSCV